MSVFIFHPKQRKPGFHFLANDFFVIFFLSVKIFIWMIFSSAENWNWKGHTLLTTARQSGGMTLNQNYEEGFAICSAEFCLKTLCRKRTLVAFVLILSIWIKSQLVKLILELFAHNFNCSLALRGLGSKHWCVLGSWRGHASSCGLPPPRHFFIQRVWGAHMLWVTKSFASNLGDRIWFCWAWGDRICVSGSHSYRLSLSSSASRFP